MAAVTIISSGVGGPGGNPSWTENSLGQYNFNGVSQNPQDATGEYPTLAAAEAAWSKEYGTTPQASATLAKATPIYTPVVNVGAPGVPASSLQLSPATTMVAYGTSGPGGNPSWTENSAGQFNFNGVSQDPGEATGFYSSLGAAQAAWIAQYGTPPPAAATPVAAAPVAAAPSPVAALLAQLTQQPATAAAVALPAAPAPLTLTSTGTGQATNVSTTTADVNSQATGTDGSSATGNASVSDALNAALANNINGGYSTSPLDAVNGSPSEAAGLEALQPTAVQTGGTSKSNPILLYVIIGIIAIVAFVVYLKLRHKGPPPPATSTFHTIATGDKVEPVTA